MELAFDSGASGSGVCTVETATKEVCNNEASTSKISNELNTGYSPTPVPVTNCKQKRESKMRRRDDRAIGNVLKGINSIAPADQFNALSQKYSELYEDFRSIQQLQTTAGKQCIVLQKERDLLKSEQSKSILQRSTLENLCRELQRQNKQIKEDNVKIVREEDERRKEVTSRFQSTFNEFTEITEESKQKNLKLKADNVDMAKKIATLYEQFEKREDQIGRMEKQMELERQLSEATVAKVKLELQAEKELWYKERAALQGNFKRSEETRVQLQANIKALEEHLQMYSGKYEEFERTISKSNKIFDNCKSEMIKMSKQIVDLEKDASTWKQRWHSNSVSLCEMSKNRKQLDSQLEMSQKKIEQLEKLCRQLQAERNHYLKLLRKSEIAIPDLLAEEHTPVAAAPNGTVEEPPPKEPSNKEQELLMLKNTMKALKYQLKTAQKESTACANNDTQGNSEVSEMPQDVAPVNV